MSEFEKSNEMNGLFAAEYRDMTASSNGETYRIFVAQPMPAEPNKKYPIIYVLDGNAQFGTVMEAQRMMAMAGELPPAFVVGIGYAFDDGFGTAMAVRNRDLTPNAGGEVERLIQAATDPGYTVAPGGATAFLDLIRHELGPALESTYPVQPGDTTLVGMSLGGLFSTWVLLTQPESFNRYVIASPSLWWNREQVWDWEEALAARQRELPASVFLSAGALETVEDNKALALTFLTATAASQEQLDERIAIMDENGWIRLAEIVPEFAVKLKSRAFRGLRLHGQIFEDETHMSVFPAAVSRGLRYVFGQ